MKTKSVRLIGATLHIIHTTVRGVGMLDIRTLDKNDPFLLLFKGPLRDISILKLILDAPVSIRTEKTTGGEQ